jgi:hypothetical protein
MTRSYFFDWSRPFQQFLQERQIAGHSILNDSDVLVVHLECHNDTALAVLMLEFAQWLKDYENDMSVNPKARGGRYHSSPPLPPVQW